MKLWVDDVKNPIEFEQLFGEWPEGEWVWVKNAERARLILEKGTVAVLALDNDLGYLSDMDGRNLAHWLLDKVLDGMKPPKIMRCISYNPVAEREIEATFGDIRDVESGGRANGNSG